MLVDGETTVLLFVYIQTDAKHWDDVYRHDDWTYYASLRQKRKEVVKEIDVELAMSDSLNEENDYVLLDPTSTLIFICNKWTSIYSTVINWENPNMMYSEQLGKIRG